VFYLANAKKVVVTQKPKLTKTEQKVADYISRYKAKGYSEKDIKNALLKSGVKPMTITKMMSLSKTKSKKPLHKSAWFWSLVVLGVIAVVLLLLFLPSCESELECYADVDCDFGMECVDGVCLDAGDDIPVTDDTECYYDSDCPTDYECVESFCTEVDDGGNGGAEPECGDDSCDIGEDCWQDCGCDNDDDCPVDYECEDDTCVEDDGGSGGGGGGGGGGDGGDGTSPECGTNDDCVEDYYCDDVGTCTDVGTTCCDCIDNGVYNWSLDATCGAFTDNHKSVCESDITAEDCVDTQPAAALVCEGYRCDDGCDNDGDGNTDYGIDRGCYRPSDDDERVSCQDGWDNDGDGLVDLDDGGCSSYADNTEDIIEYRCNDGIDNDGDGNMDMMDSGCLALIDDDERVECDDGIDNDGDGLVDLADIDCYRSSDNSEYETGKTRTPFGVILEFVLGGLNL
jgi:hypothetical protein